MEDKNLYYSTFQRENRRAFFCFGIILFCIFAKKYNSKNG